jgi:hypothetical protein
MTATTDFNDYAPSNGQISEQRRSFGRVKAKLKDQAGKVQSRAEDLAENARVYAEDALGQLNSFSRTAVAKAQEKPATSALVILGVGIAVGAILALSLRQPASALADNALDGATRLRRRLRG